MNQSLQRDIDIRSKEIGTRETFVLVTGTCHGGWAWRPVANELRAAGHQVHTPTLAGLGEGDDPTDVTLTDCRPWRRRSGGVCAEPWGELCDVDHSIGRELPARTIRLLERTTAFASASRRPAPFAEHKGVP